MRLLRSPTGPAYGKCIFTRNSKSWVCGHPNRKKYMYRSAVTDVHWPSDLFPSIKFPEKQSCPKWRPLYHISHQFHLLPAWRVINNPQPHPLAIWVSDSSLDTWDESHREMSKLSKRHLRLRFKQIKMMALHLSLILLFMPSHKPLHVLAHFQIHPPLFP